MSLLLAGNGLLLLAGRRRVHGGERVGWGGAAGYMGAAEG